MNKKCEKCCANCFHLVDMFKCAYKSGLIEEHESKTSWCKCWQKDK